MLCAGVAVMLDWRREEEEEAAEQTEAVDGISKR